MPVVPLAMRQPPAHSWRPQGLPGRPGGLRQSAPRVGASATARDGPERRRQRPTAARGPPAPSSGKHKTPTAQTLLGGHALTSPVGARGPTRAGRTPAKQAAAEAQSAEPPPATLATDPGLQGSEPAGRRRPQPPKSPQAGRGAEGPRAFLTASLVSASGWTTCWRG